MVTRRTLVAVLLGLAAGAGAAEAQSLSLPPSPAAKPKQVHPAVAALRQCRARIVTSLGTLEVDLLPDAAPNAARTFVKLARQGHYDRTAFLAVFPGRMVLAGQPPGEGETGPTVAFEDSSEASFFGSHIPGTVAFDRGAGGGANVAGRLFINLRGRRHLDGDYTVFGLVTRGMEVARRIGELPSESRDGRPVPLESVAIERIVVTRRDEEPRETEAEE
ncbi:MAG: peptidylprolyl isomerase [Candidatus Brocadiia bacterium]